MLSEEERLILLFLKQAPKSFFTATEIARRAAGRKRFEEDPRWAVPALLRLRDRKLVEMDADGRYRLQTGAR